MSYTRNDYTSQDGYPYHPTYTSKPIIKYLAHTPRRSQEIHVLEHPYENLSIKKYPVVLVDTEVFISYWKQQCSPNRFQRIKNYFRGKVNASNFDNDDIELLNSSYETSLKYCIPIDMACGVCLNYENKIRFTDGRHRVVNLANAGAPFIPVQTSKDELNTFRELFEWEPAKNNTIIYK